MIHRFNRGAGRRGSQVPDVVGGAVALGGEWWHVAAPLSIAVMVAASWALRPRSRMLPGLEVLRNG